MDAPAMFTREQVPEDVGLSNTGSDEGGQSQLHRDEKEHKPVLKKVKEKVKKIKHTLAGHSHGHGNGNGDEHGREDRFDDNDVSSGDEEEGNAALEREAAMEKGGYMGDDVQDKPVASEPEPELHGAPMCESERTPAVQDLVAKYDPLKKAPAAREAHRADAPGVRFGDLGGGHGTFGHEARRDDSPKVRLGDLGGPVVEDPAAPRSTTPAAREGQDIGTTPVVREFESMTLSDDPSHVGAGKMGARAEDWKDAAADKLGGGASGGTTYTERLKNAAAVPAEYGRKLANTVYEKVAGGGGTPAAGAEKRDEAMPVSDARAGVEEFKDAPVAAAVDTTTTDRSSGPGYTDKIKSTAAGTTEYGKQLASAAYEKVAAVAPRLRQQEGAGKNSEEARNNEATPPPVSDAVGTGERKDAMLTDLSSRDTAASGSPGYTEKIKSAAAGTTEYGKQLASTVYENVAGVGTAVAGKVQQATKSAGTATPGVGAQHDCTTVTPGAGGRGNGQDKGVTMTGYITEELRPGDEDRALSEAISGAVQRRKEEVGGTVGQRVPVPAPGQVFTKAREAVTSLTGGNRVSDTVQPDAATGAEVKDNVGAEAPMLRGEEMREPRLNTNTM